MSSKCPHLSDIRIPIVGSSLIHKEECTQCYSSDLTGLNVCLTCFNGGCTAEEGNEDHSQQHSQISGHPIVLHIIKREIVQDPQSNNTETPPQKITKLAINKPGGLQTDENNGNTQNYFYDTKVYCFKCKTDIPTDSTPELQKSVEAVLQFNSASQPTVTDGGLGWENEVLQGCPHTKNLEQIQNPPKYSASTMNQCKTSGCDKTKALWFCLTCGTLNCPRSGQYGDPNSGNGHALKHYEQSKHPLVLKIGTIKPDGTADVHCYGCDNTVVNENLTKHLSHFGIDVGEQEATEKTTAEVELQAALSMDWSGAFDEEGKDLQLIYGPCYTGLSNLGNSCYMASVIQVIMSLPSFQHRYVAEGREHLLTCRNNRPAECFHCQMAKLAIALSNGKYSPQPTKEQLEYYEKRRLQDQKDKENARNNQTNQDTNMAAEDEKESRKRKQPSNDEVKSTPAVLQPGIPPRMFKRLIAKDHADFSKAKQQDALEFLHYFLQQIQQREKVANIDPTNIFNFKQEERIQCLNCKGVRYSVGNNIEISLPIPLGEPEIKIADNEKKTETKIYPPVKFEDCIKEWAATGVTDDYMCSVCNSKQKLAKQSRFHTFPDTLLVQMRRFTYEGWVPTKLEIEIQTPLEIDLSNIRASGLQSNEKEFPSNSSSTSAAPAKKEADMSIVTQLESMGFSRNACIRAALAVNNSNVDAASNWLFGHLEDADINDPIPEDKPATTSSNNKSNEPAADLIEQLQAMGFDRPRCVYALKQCSNSVDRSVEWLFSHMDDPIPSETDSKSNTSTAANNGPIDSKPARYRLYAYINHMGKSAGSGHYACCIMREGKWVVYNDHKVHLASETMKKTSPENAYLYFFRRIPA